MDTDLQDLISAWLGGDLDPARAAELLRRLRDDAEFRREFVEQAQMLSAIKAVQSAEPRWLLLEDEIGRGASADPADPLEDRVLRAIEGPRRRRLVAWAVVATVTIVAVAVVGWPSAPSPRRVADPTATVGTVAVLVKADDVHWESSDNPPPTEGSPLGAGPLRLRSGQITLNFVNGVILSVVGPAELDVRSADRVFCRRGKLRTRVPPGAEGFTVLAPGSAVVDLGTEFALNVADDGTAEVMVFEGRAEVSVLNAAGHTLSSELCQSRNALAIDPAAGRIRDATAEPARFAPPVTWSAPPLVLKPGTAASVLSSRPWGYWRFREQADGVVPNEVAGGPAFRAANGVRLVGTGEAGVAEFVAGRPDQTLVLDGTWTPPRADGYAIELWALSERFQHSSLVSVSPDGAPGDRHTALLEFTGRSRDLLHEECTVRLLDRWPPSRKGGANVFSSTMYTPNRWHHLVAQFRPTGLELYVDGVLAGSSPTRSGAETAPCRMILGRMKIGPDRDPQQVRPLVGRIAEVAVYNRPLSPAEIRRHAAATHVEP
jgi:ferric-dicitrate binding protein FerR (iron transport regulator)